MYSYCLPKLIKNIDVRDGSPDHNPGGHNAIAAAGKPLGLLCIVLDILKAFLPVYAAITCGGLRGGFLVPVVTAPVLGHAFSPFLRFRGGKAVAAFYGVLLALWPVSHVVLLPAAAMVFFKFIFMVKPDSLCVFVSMFTAGCALFFLEPDSVVRTAFLLVQFVVLFKIARSPNPEKTSVSIGRRTFPLTVSFFPRFRRP